MEEISNFIYFLNSTKDILPFTDEKDFEKKINENRNFKIKVQKMVYLSKFFGWDNPYIFTLSARGPYSVELKQLYGMPNLWDNVPEKIKCFDVHSFHDFVKNKNLLFLEASATILYKFKDNIPEKTECVTSIHALKRHISTEIIQDAYDLIENFRLWEDNLPINEDAIDNLESAVKNKIDMINKHFEEYEDSRNKIIVLGSIDYMRIALRESNLNLEDEYELLMFIKRYLTIIQRIPDEISPNDFMELNLENLEEIFNQFQEFVSEEHPIIKKIDDDDFDQSLFY